MAFVKKELVNRVRLDLLNMGVLATKSIYSF